MIQNVFEFNSSPQGIQKTLNIDIKKNVNSKIKFVRLASHFGEIKAFKFFPKYFSLFFGIFCCMIF